MSKLSRFLNKAFGIPEVRITDYVEIKLKPKAVEKARSKFLEECKLRGIDERDAAALWTIVQVVLITGGA